VPKKVSTKISDNAGKNAYGTPSKKSHGHIGQSFDFSSDNDGEDESGDKVGHLRASSPLIGKVR
jgi:hypothetical protein